MPAHGIFMKSSVNPMLHWCHDYLMGQTPATALKIKKADLNLTSNLNWINHMCDLEYFYAMVFKTNNGKQTIIVNRM